MATRLKVLMSAYACEPGKGSEPEVGWQWALQMARFHDVTVLTRSNNRPAIEPVLNLLQSRQPLPRFVYHDCSPLLLKFKRRFKATKSYYVLWQRSAQQVVRQLQQAHHFDLLHHVTFAAFRYSTAIWEQGAPSIWGPVGGIESIPTALLPWRHPVSLIHEIPRNAHNFMQTSLFPAFRRRARASTLLLATTREMQVAFAKLGFEAEIMPTIGLRTAELPWQPHRRPEGPLKLLFVGNIITLKGLDLALEALKASGADATFALVGTGNYLDAAEQLASSLGLEQRVTFLGRLTREAVLKVYRDYDIFFFPSLHDTGGYAVIEAMVNELPVICLDCGGPAVAVRDNCGIKVSLGPRAKVISDLAAAIRSYHQNRAAVVEHGHQARESVLRYYEWERKGEQMNECYLAAVSGFSTRRRNDSTRDPTSSSPELTMQRGVGKRQ